MILVGVDAGGTATTARVWRDGVALATARGGAGAVRPARTVAAAARIADTARVALAEAGVRRADHLVVGAAGAGRDPERSELRSALRGHDVAESLTVVTDVELALAAAFGRGPGILLAAGTGSIALRREPDGGLRRAGGYGWQAGDEGSGYWIGREALSAVGRARDGRGPATTLGSHLATLLRVQGEGALVRWSVAASPAEVAALAPAVHAAVEAGDPVALGILERAASELAALVRALGPEPAEVALTGGLLRPGRALRGLVQRELAGAGALVVRADDIEPVDGALALLESDSAPRPPRG